MSTCSYKYFIQFSAKNSSIFYYNLYISIYTSTFTTTTPLDFN